MRRRDFITFVAGSAAVWPLATRAQHAIPVIGYLHLDSPSVAAPLLAAFREGLAEAGYVEGKNVAIEFRWAQNEPSRIPELVADLVQKKVAVIATPGIAAAALAAKAATKTIPIVFSTGLDPVRLGLVASLNRPGENVTGVNSMLNELGGKRLGLLHELLPAAERFAMLVNPKNPTSSAAIRGVQTAAAAINCQIEVLTASNEIEIDAAFASLAQRRTPGFLVHPDNLFIGRREQLIVLAARNAVPAIYPLRADAEAGGLMSYGTALSEVHRQAGVYTGRILKGARPADLPVIQPTKFELVINFKTAKALGVTIPLSVQSRADEMIE